MKDSKRKVLIITYYWPPSGGAGVQRWLKFAKYLPEFGWEPVILTVDPNFASYPQIDDTLMEDAVQIETFRTKSFELYSLYTKFFGAKEIPYGGFSNEGKPSFIQKIARFLRGNLFIPDSRKGWNRYAYKVACKIIENENVEVVVTTSPPHSTQLLGRKLKKDFNNKIRWISDLRDPWTDIYYYNKFYPTRLTKYIDGRLEKSVVKNSDLLITVSPYIKKLLSKKYGFGDKIRVITNGFDSDDFVDFSQRNSIQHNEVLYTGTLSDDYPLEEIILLAKLLPSKTFRFIGTVSEKLRQMTFDNGLSNQFVFQPSITHDAITKEMMKAGALLLLIPKIEKNEGILTGKLFEYIGADRPIIAIGPENSDLITILKDIYGAIFLSYSDMNNLKDLAIETTEYKNPYYLQRNLTFSRKKLTEQLVSLFDM